MKILAALVLLATVVLVGGAGRGFAADPTSCDLPVNPTYVQIQTYNQFCSSPVDLWGNSVADHKITRSVWGTPLEITSSGALGGAISSIKVNGVEMVLSGGHGAAAQWAFHTDGLGECSNPTQAGSRSDDSNPAYPAQKQFHGPGRSSILSSTFTPGRSVRTSRMAMWLLHGETSPYCPAGITASYPAGSVPRLYGLSNFWLTNDVSAPTTSGLYADRQNVFAINATVSGLQATPNFDGFFITYLQSNFNRYYQYDMTTKRLVPVAYGSIASNQPLVACDVNGWYCYGLFFDPDRTSELYYYATTQTDPGHQASILQVTIKPAPYVVGAQRQYEVLGMVGGLGLLEDTICILNSRSQGVWVNTCQR